MRFETRLSRCIQSISSAVIRQLAGVRDDTVREHRILPYITFRTRWRSIANVLRAILELPTIVNSPVNLV
jgi:hypothetical protein